MEGISTFAHVVPLLFRRGRRLQTKFATCTSLPRLSLHHTNTMVVAEFTDSNDTHPRVVAGTTPTAEETTASNSTTDKTTVESSTSTYADKAASGKS